VDTDHKKFYPIAEWSNKNVLDYCKRKKLPLPIGYHHGFRDMTEFTGASLIWLANNYPADFEKEKKVFPMLEGELIKAYELVHGS
jgi:sulfate adenylyltransferase subunit 2